MTAFDWFSIGVIVGAALAALAAVIFVALLWAAKA